MKADNNAECDNDIPNMLQVLDKVEPVSQPGERSLNCQNISTNKSELISSWTDAGWRVLFNQLANYNWLGKVRKTKLYHNTSDVINRSL